MLAIRRHLLPNEEDDASSIARALWLYKNQREELGMIIANAVNRAFAGK